MIQIGGENAAFRQEEGILLQKYRDRNGRCIAILCKSIGVRGRCGSPDSRPAKAETCANNEKHVCKFLASMLADTIQSSSSNHRKLISLNCL